MTDDSDPQDVQDWLQKPLEDVTPNPVNTERVNVEGHIPIEELEALADAWEDEYQTYIDSDVECERTMSVQQYKDTEELRSLIAEYRGASDE